MGAAHRVLPERSHLPSRALGFERCRALTFCLFSHFFPPPSSSVSVQITFTVVSEKQPTEQQLEDLKFAWTCVKHVKSNAITVAKDGRLLGMGSGQPNRVKSVQISLEKAGEEAKVR